MKISLGYLNKIASKQITAWRFYAFNKASKNRLATSLS